MELILRKGFIIDKKPNDMYIVSDIFNKEEIVMSLSGRERASVLKLKLNEIVYVIVSPYDTSRGRYYSKHQVKHLNIDFESMKNDLDNK